MASDLQPLSTPILFLNTSGVNIMPEYVRILCQSMCECAQICINGFSYVLHDYIVIPCELEYLFIYLF